MRNRVVAVGEDVWARRRTIKVNRIIRPGSENRGARSVSMILNICNIVVANKTARIRFKPI